MAGIEILFFGIATSSTGGSESEPRQPYSGLDLCMCTCSVNPSSTSGEDSAAASLLNNDQSERVIGPGHGIDTKFIECDEGGERIEGKKEVGKEDGKRGEGSGLMSD